MIKIVEATTKQQMKKFAKFPCDLYKGNKYYVPSLRSDDYNMADPTKNFNAKYCNIKCFLAYKDEKIVGRVAGIIHNKFNKLNNVKYIRFCRFDFIEDIEVCRALLEAVEKFALENGISLIHGPWGFNDTEREGMLTVGFDKRSTYATNYNFPYYPEFLKKLGYQTESVWEEYKFIIPNEVDPKISRMSALVKKKFGLKDIADEMTLKEFIDKYCDEFFDVYNACYAKLDNFIPIEGAEKQNILNQFATIIKERYFSAIVNEKDELVAFGIMMPSIADALIKSRGRYSVGLVKAILKPKELECALIGVRPDYQKLGINAVMIDKILSNVIKDGIKDVESNPMLVTNSSIHAQFSVFNFERVKQRETFYKNI